MKAVWNNTTIAESDETVSVEGNEYFPAESVKSEYLESSSHHYTCPWKGEARYFHVSVEGKREENAAWSYPDPSEAAQAIKGHIAFGNGVEITP